MYVSRWLECLGVDVTSAFHLPVCSNAAAVEELKNCSVLPAEESWCCGVYDVIVFCDAGYNYELP